VENHNKYAIVDFMHTSKDKAKEKALADKIRLRDEQTMRRNKEMTIHSYSESGDFNIKS